jgi:hypothetical protein
MTRTARLAIKEKISAEERVCGWRLNLPWLISEIAVNFDLTG